MNSNTAATHIHPEQPIIVGGVGGGGTRVIAQILRQLDIHVGVCLNTASDNLWFTLLFRRRRWLANAIATENKPLYQALEIFQAASLNQRRLTPAEIYFIVTAVPETCWHWGKGPSLRLDKALRASVSLMRQPANRWSQYQGWGWKEPNSQLFLPYLNEFFPKMRYVQVIRHGLDMAYSRNQYQLHYWGHLFGLDRSTIAASPLTASLDYWIRSNQQAIDFGRRELRERFLLLNIDALCQHPGDEIQRLVNFLELPISDVHLSHLASIPRVPATTGRYRQAKLDVFRPDQLAAVQQLGYAID